TGNIWLNIIAHGFYNGTAVTVLYITKLNNPNADLSKADPQFPMWTAALAVAVVIGLFIAFDKVSKYQVDRPGEEVPLPVENGNDLSWLNTAPPTNDDV